MEVVDGQQRLITLVILLRQVTEHFRRFSTNSAKEAAQRLWQDYVKLTPNGPYLLELNDPSVNRFFIDVVLEASASREPGSFTERNLSDAKREFDRYLSSQASALRQGFLAYLENLTAIVTSSLKFLLYKPEGQAQACFMFESMNARGLELTQLEKTKNLLFFLAYKYKRDDNQLSYLTRAINDTWRDIWKDLYTAQGADEDQFLRFHWAVFEGEAWMVNNEPTRTVDIHDAIRKTVKERLPKGIEVCDWLDQYLQSLRAYSPLYRDLVYPDFGKSFVSLIHLRDTLIQLVESTQRIGREANLIPIMMAAYRRYTANPDALKEVFRLAEVLSFRLLAVGKRADAGRKKAFDIARDIGRQSVSPPDAIDRLRQLIDDYCGDDAFRQALEDTRGDFYHWDGIRYFLFEYERELKRKSKIAFTYDWDVFRKQELEQSIEHILPQGDETPRSDYWRAYWGHFWSEEDWSRCRHLLGNLNLAMPSWNSSYSAKPFPEKRGGAGSADDAKVYARSPWYCEQELAKLENWTPETLRERQKKLADWAVKRWPIRG
jgi:hypothetical protein